MIDLSGHVFTLDSINLSPYKIKLISPWKNSKEILNYRSGFIVNACMNDGTQIISECAPMESIGTESLQLAETTLESKLMQLKETTLSSHTLIGMDSTPASRFALETLLLACITKQNGYPLFHQLNFKSNGHIKINAMLGNISTDATGQLERAHSTGYHCVKYKIGIQNIDEDLDIILKILNNIQSKEWPLKIRLDANKAWSFEQTLYLLEKLAPYENFIDYIEEPLNKFNLNHYKELQNSTNLKLALDESFKTQFLNNHSIKDYPLHRLVIKPMAQGGILNSLLLAKRAQKHNIETIISSSIETGHGLRFLMDLAAALDNNQCHGLDTANWLSDPLVKTPEIVNGTITL